MEPGMVVYILAQTVAVLHVVVVVDDGDVDSLCNPHWYQMTHKTFPFHRPLLWFDETLA
jgi:hypothetical protein